MEYESHASSGFPQQISEWPPTGGTFGGTSSYKDPAARKQELLEQVAKLKAKEDTDLPVFDGREYSRVAPGRYSGIGVRALGPQLVRKFKRWSIAIEFSLHAEAARVMAFFNLGSGDRPHVGRGSRYFSAWTTAAGDTPRKGETMDPAVFLEGQIFELEVCDSKTDAAGDSKADGLVYSRVSAIISATRPARSQDSPRPGEGQTAHPKPDHKTGAVNQLSRSGQSSPKRVLL